MSVVVFSARRTITAFLLVTLGACSTIGEKEFSCPGRPTGVRCMSATEVYRATQNTDFVEPTAEEPLGDAPEAGDASKHHSSAKPGSATNQRPAPKTPDSQTATARAELLTPAVDRPIPIRTPAKVMRAWIAPWEDARGVLHTGGYAYIEIESRRWSFGEANLTEPVRLFSIQTNAVGTKETVGKDQGDAPARAGTSERPNSSTLPKTGVPK